MLNVDGKIKSENKLYKYLNSQKITIEISGIYAKHNCVRFVWIALCVISKNKKIVFTMDLTNGSF